MSTLQKQPDWLVPLVKLPPPYRRPTEWGAMPGPIQAEARIELQADELQQARRQHEKNQSENQVAYQFYEDLVSVAKDDHERRQQMITFRSWSSTLSVRTR